MLPTRVLWRTTSANGNVVEAVIVRQVGDRVHRRHPAQRCRPATPAPLCINPMPWRGPKRSGSPCSRCSIVNIAGQVDRRILPSLLLAGEGHVQSATPVRPRSGRAPQVVLALREVASLHGHVHPIRRLHALRVVRPGVERPEATGAAQLGAALPVDSGRQKGRRRPTERWPSRRLAQHVRRWQQRPNGACGRAGD